ncbi:MAG: hypothetical protein RLY35_35 [Bacteroidota bacterium]|jgi:hypothetical protein
MKKTILWMMALTIGAMTNMGCAKKEGCMNPQATNYNEDAKKDCNCCTYSGEVVFWVNQTSASYISTTGLASTLKYYVDGQFVGSNAASQYWTSAPTCGQNSSITVTKDLGTNKTKGYSFSVVDEDGYTWWEGTINFDGERCTSYELNL